jgi:hypothetical protein
MLVGEKLGGPSGRDDLTLNPHTIPDIFTVADPSANDRPERQSFANDKLDSRNPVRLNREAVVPLECERVVSARDTGRGLA